MASGNDPGRLTWNVPITNPDGTPTNEFMRKWQAQAVVNADIPDLADAAAVSTVLDYIGSAPGDILARGTAMWQALAAGADGRVLRAKGAAMPEWDTVAALLDQVASTQGDILYRNATTWVALAPGTAGYVLTSGGAGADPSWVAPGGGGGSTGILKPETVVAVSSGSHTIADSTGWLQLAPTGSVNPYALTMPASPSDGQELLIELTTAHLLNGLSISANVGQSIVHESIGLLGSQFSWRRYGYNLADTTWYQLGGASNAF